jgi:hypothetical protein
MPLLTDNDDGTTSITINSDELRALKQWLEEYLPGYKKAVQIVDGPEVRAVLRFLRSAIT